ncbi:YdcF family protein [Rhizobium sp. CFBP 8762]|uniref:YdcF family protein n=1 Tax=Rhizobium sp. CFBP 8762 TaxID=2775279 RepID=UPI001784318E|nr:YdcF family protein [Rhizobium sp. CFBP 8762]MBD8555400.1 YdcF family protein [Rhizobium sp. CFBP 8762]
MFFLLSKLFWLVAQPLSLAFILIVLSVSAGLFGWRRLQMVWAGTAGLLLFVTLFTTTGERLLAVLEDRFPNPPALTQPLSCMIVLGGAFSNEVTTSRGGIELNQAGDRYVEALRLAQLYPQARIVISGGDGSLSGSYEGDAAISQRFFQAFGIAPERLVLESTSRNTVENAANTKTLLDENGLANCALITSAFHMPRSIGIFRKQGIPVLPWPTDYRTQADTRLGFDFTQPSRNAQLMTTALREWIGLLAYSISGRTAALFPK